MSGVDRVETAQRMEESPPEAEQLLAVAPEEFVAERARVARELREGDRPDDARAVAALKKPPPVVLAVNHAARVLPDAARAAVDAAERVRTAQFAGEADAYRDALDDLETSISTLTTEAVDRLSGDKPATEATRRRVIEHLRAAVADSSSRDAFLRGALVEEQEAGGFAAFGGLTPPPRSATKAASPKRDRAAERLRERREKLDGELNEAKDALRAAERAVTAAERDRDRLAKRVASIEAELERL